MSIEKVVNEHWLSNFKKFTLENADMKYWVIPDANIKRDEVYLVCSYEMYNKIMEIENPRREKMNIEDALLIIVNEIIRIKNITDPLRDIEEDEPLLEIAREMLEQLRQGERSEY